MRVAKPGTPASALSVRYAPRWYTRTSALDVLGRTLAISTGATSPELLGSNGASTLTFAYAKGGNTSGVAGSYGTLWSDPHRFADGRLERVRMGDAAGTQRFFQYNVAHRLSNVFTSRAQAAPWSQPPTTAYPAANALEPTQQMLLEDTDFGYDALGNLTTIADYRDPNDWPSGAKPVSRTLDYDDLYRLTSVTYSHGTAPDVWTSPYAAELVHAERVQPSPYVSFQNRVQLQSFSYDYVNNMRVSADDAVGGWDRSTGQRTFGTPASGPNRLQTATVGGPHSPRRAYVQTGFDAAGDVTVVTVNRGGPCLPSGASCSQRYAYLWDEIGNLSRARRWDLNASNGERTTFAVPTAPNPARLPDADMTYVYSGTARVLKSADSPGRETSYAVYLYDSLELRGSQWNVSSGDYQLDASTEQVRLNGGAVVGRVVHLTESVPSLMSGGQHVFLQFADQIGSTAFSTDKASGELVEYTTYTAYGSVDSAYRPERWAAQREPYKYTGKEEDVEVGLVYFGARYYSPYAALWMSPDPLRVHQLSSDLNPYGYVGGSPLMRVDPDGRGFVVALIVGVIIGLVVGATTSAVAQGCKVGWNHINWGLNGVLGSGLIGGAAGLAGGLAGAAAGAAAGALGAAATTSALVGGAVGGAVGGLTGHLISAAISGARSGGGALGISVLAGAVAGFVSSGMSAATGGSWYGSAAAGVVGTASGTGVSAAMGSRVSAADFALSLGASVAGAVAAHGLTPEDGSPQPRAAGSAPSGWGKEGPMCELADVSAVRLSPGLSKPVQLADLSLDQIAGEYWSQLGAEAEYFLYDAVPTAYFTFLEEAAWMAAGEGAGAVLGRIAGWGMARFGAGAARGAATAEGMATSANGVRLAKQLASEAGSAELLAGGGKSMAGAGTKTPIRDVGRLVAEHGGSPGDWAKVRSNTFKIVDGVTVEVHGYMNVATRTVVELKSKVGLWGP